jgi:hypothetical protein
MSFHSSLKDEIVDDIEARIAAWTFLPQGMFFTCVLVYDVLIYAEKNLYFLCPLVIRKRGVHSNTTL